MDHPMWRLVGATGCTGAVAAGAATPARVGRVMAVRVVDAAVACRGLLPTGGSPGTALHGKEAAEVGIGATEIDGLVALLFLKVLVGLQPLEGDLQLALQLAGVGALLGHDEGGGYAGCARAASATDAVDEVLGSIGHVVVDDVRDVLDVDAAGGDVGRDQYAMLAGREALEGGGALRLGTVAVDSVGIVAELLQLLGDTVCAVLRAGEDEEGAGFFAQHLV